MCTSQQYKLNRLQEINILWNKKATIKVYFLNFGLNTFIQKDYYILFREFPDIYRVLLGVS